MSKESNYTARPLNDAERLFATEHISDLYGWMRGNRLDEEEWYDILIIPYLNAVKKYVTERPDLQMYAFPTILKAKLSTAYHNHFRALNTASRMPKGGFVSLDTMVENNNRNSESRIEAWWIDPAVDVEKQLIRQENHKEFCEHFNQFVEVLNQRVENREWMAKEFKTCVECLIKGRTKKQALRAANRDKERRKGRGYSTERGNYTFTYIFDEYEEDMLEWDLEELREVFRDIFGC